MLLQLDEAGPKPAHKKKPVKQHTGPLSPGEKAALDSTITQGLNKQKGHMKPPETEQDHRAQNVQRQATVDEAHALNVAHTTGVLDVHPQLLHSRPSRDTTLRVSLKRNHKSRSRNGAVRLRRSTRRRNMQPRQATRNTPCTKG